MTVVSIDYVYLRCTRACSGCASEVWLVRGFGSRFGLRSSPDRHIRRGPRVSPARRQYRRGPGPSRSSRRGKSHLGYSTAVTSKSRAGATSPPCCNVERKTRVYVLKERRRNSRRDGGDGSVGRLGIPGLRVSVDRSVTSPVDGPVDSVFKNHRGDEEWRIPNPRARWWPTKSKTNRSTDLLATATSIPHDSGPQCIRSQIRWRWHGGVGSRASCQEERSGMLDWGTWEWRDSEALPPALSQIWNSKTTNAAGTGGG